MRSTALPVFILAVMLGALPTSAQTSRVPLFVPPPNWSVISRDSLMNGLQTIWQGPLPFAPGDVSLMGMWVGGGPMQMISLARGRAVASPDTVAALFPSSDKRYGTQVHYRVASERHSFCGLPGTLVNVEFGQMINALRANDRARYYDSLSGGIELQPGTKVLVDKELGIDGTEIRLHIVTGPYKGRYCWSSGTAKGLFKRST